MKPSIVVAIPVYKQFSSLSASEQLSLQNTANVLRGYDFVLVSPAGLDTVPYHVALGPTATTTTIAFDPSYFTGLVDYSQLLLSLEFYNCFASYDYLLICQLDVFVFADQLEYFAGKGYDYIGAPWFEGFNNATSQSRIIGVGNGGFSLRKVKSFLTILTTLELFRKRKPALAVVQTAARHWVSVLRVIKHEFHRRTRPYDAALPWNTQHFEDIYWGITAKLFFPWFKVGSVPDATAFAFEVNPGILYTLNQQRLPMATHAWEKHDPDFWQPFIKEDKAPNYG